MTRRISRVGLVAKQRVDAAASVLVELAGWLEARGLEPVFETYAAQLAGVTGGAEIVSKEELPGACDLLVLLGGDGTLIGMARRVARAGADVPIAGVNFGSLGFLTEITLDDLYPSLEGVLDGTAPIEERMMLHAKVLRGGTCFTDELVLNDVVTTKAALSRIIELSVSIGTDRVMQVRADGLIVATPTGSTAYSLSARGPIVSPRHRALLLTPVAPHMLFDRSLVLDPSETIEIEVAGHRDARLAIDGRPVATLVDGDVVRCVPSASTACFVRFGDWSYHQILKAKFGLTDR